MKATVICLAATVLPLPACIHSSDLIKRRNVELILVQHSQLWSKGDVSVIDRDYASDYVGHFPEGIVHGPAGVRASVESHRTSFPDWTETVDDVIADGDRVVTRFTSRGTNLGAFSGRPPTGRRVEISEVCIHRITDGKIVEQWVYPDIVSLQRQLRKEP